MGKRMKIGAAGFALAGIILSCNAAFALQSSPQPADHPSSPEAAPRQNAVPLGRNLGQGYSLKLEASPIAGNTSVTDISQLNTYTLGLSLEKADVAVKGDKLGLELTRPIHAGADDGPLAPHANFGAADRETVLSLIYSQPLDPTTTGSISLSARQNADDIMGRGDFAGMLRLRHSF